MSHRRWSAAIVAATLISLGASPALADECLKPGAEPAGELAFDCDVDLPVALFAVYAWVASEKLKPHLARDRCLWCEDNALDRAARDALVWRAPHDAATISDVLLFAGTPVLALGLLALAEGVDHRLRNFPVDAMIVVETAGLSVDLNQATKLIAGRQRPFARYAAPGTLASDRDVADDNLSFYSGHTTTTFTVAAANGMVTSLRHYKLAPLVWAVGMAHAGVTSYLRMGADKHYLTDVLTGAVLGTAIGAGVPYLWHHLRSGRARAPIGLSIVPSREGVAAGVHGAW